MSAKSAVPSVLAGAFALVVAGCATSRRVDVPMFQVGLHIEGLDVTAGDGTVVWTQDGEEYSVRTWLVCENVGQRNADGYTRVVIRCGRVPK